ncbi:sulfite exporter TauE/SafE family protein [Pedobacter arcticus]|uniref:sulfite exporter TauE/SafE family protein n=1 Tax=Pedobacter arcticus TaxID=752140 RepID=UPI00036C60C1|nr:sulfite exporter TauE/SafE family protein [Pedobacter arcticus]
MHPTTIYILLIVFIATLVRSTFGFGESLVAVPLLLFFMPIETAVPLCVLLSVFIAMVLLSRDRKKVQFKSAKWLVVFAILGVPIGLFTLIYMDESIVKVGLGGLIIGYSVYSLVSTSVFKLKSDNMFWLFICGFFSGIFGGAYGLNGPPIVIYGDMRSWTPAYFRATLQAYFLPLGIVGLFGYWFYGILDVEVFRYFLMSLPIVLLAIYFGNYLHSHIKEGAFLRYVHIGLLAIGVLLLCHAF